LSVFGTLGAGLVVLEASVVGGFASAPSTIMAFELAVAVVLAVVVAIEVESVLGAGVVT
jgi:hypothetical protein